MAQNVDMLRQGYEAFGRGDMDAVMETWNDDIEWEGPNTDRLPGAGTHRGREATAKMLGELSENWDGLTVSPDEFVDGGDTVVVLGRYEGVARGTGRRLDVPFARVWTFRHGRAVRFRQFLDTAGWNDALAAS